MARPQPDPSNSVHLTGRLVAVREVSLPSGDALVSFRVVVDRSPRDRGPSGRVLVDAVECTAWRADVRRRALATPEGTRVEVTGSLRRRFWRAGSAPASRVDVEAVTLHRAQDESMTR